MSLETHPWCFLFIVFSAYLAGKGHLYASCLQKGIHLDEETATIAAG